VLLLLLLPPPQVCSSMYGDDASSLEVTLCNAVQLQLSALSLGPPSQAIIEQAQQQVRCCALAYNALHTRV
jgi:hypothetical protein